MFIEDLSTANWVKNTKQTFLSEQLTFWWGVCDFVSENVLRYVLRGVWGGRWGTVTYEWE